MKIVGIAGSMNSSSTTKQAVNIILNAAKQAGADIEMVHLAEWNMPLYDDREDYSTYPEVVHRFVKTITEADGLVIGSPEYHGSITGALKNSLDFLEGRHLRDKQVAIVGVAGGSMGATNTVNTLQMIMRNLHAWPLPSSPSIPSAYSAFTPEGTLKDERLQARMQALGKQLVQYIQMMNPEKQKQPN